MSFIVSKTHIDVLVHALLSNGVVWDLEPDKIGHTLWRDNHRSVNFETGGRAKTPHYEYAQPAGEPQLPVVNGAARSYRFNSNLRKDWPRTKSKEWIEALIEFLEPRVDPADVSDGWSIPNGYRYPSARAMR